MHATLKMVWDTIDGRTGTLHGRWTLRLPNARTEFSPRTPVALPRELHGDQASARATRVHFREGQTGVPLIDRRPGIHVFASNVQWLKGPLP